MLKTHNALQESYAERELARLHLLRGVSEASKQKESQTAIARDAGISQPEVHRILRKISDFPKMLERTPREVILLWVTGRISHDELMGELLSWPYTFSVDAEPANPLGQYSSGTWEQVTEAMLRGLLGEEDYRRLVERVRPDTAA
ncbi:hypothetical protein [Sinomonas terrae]|uniref:Uncharacterized protein n=1 Tax=Sinomonas terrae TaxID=2908838 RepID=A0ABS9U7A2_9MICC|nr:hypothetical protein [Sinomonas terrae]MCH6472581.1 hypothetical protein [Sinomonas terrae]